MTYRIGKLAKKIGVNEHTLRYYEKEGLVVPQRDENNIRYYTEENKLWVEFILHMKETGMSIEDLKRYTTLWKLGEEGIPEMINILSKHRSAVIDKIETYNKNLELLNTKIEFYQKNLMKHKTEDLFEKFIQKKMNGDTLIKNEEEDLR